MPLMALMRTTAQRRKPCAQEGFLIEDDMGATDEYTREDDDEAEFLRARARAEEEQARKRAEEGEPSGAAAPANGGPGKHIHF